MQITNIQHDYQNQLVYFKVVGVNLDKWLGNGYGILYFSVTSNGESAGYGPYNASGSGGARSPTISARYPGTQKPPAVTVDAAIETTNGDVLCEGYYQF